MKSCGAAELKSADTIEVKLLAVIRFSIGFSVFLCSRAALDGERDTFWLASCT